MPDSASDALADSVSAIDEYKPQEPIMGGLVQISASDWCPWTGGKPLADWSGLDPAASKQPDEDFQYRPTTPGSSQKSTKYREQGLEQKFGRTDRLLDFVDTVHIYFKRTGMDSITYLPDPNDPTTMISTLTDYDKFEVAAASAVSKNLRETKFDRFDKNNDDSASNWLLNSIDPALQREVQDRVHSTAGFVAHWLQLIHLIQSTSYKRFAILKDDIERKLTVFQFPGQNIQALATQFLNKARELDNHGFYEHRLTLCMLDRFLEGGGSGSDIYTLQYRHELLSIRKELDSALIRTSRMSTPEAKTYMTDHELTHRDICNKAEEAWRKLYDDNRWAPARVRRDNRRPPAQFEANVTELTTDSPSAVPPEMTTAMLNALVQQVQQLQSSLSPGNPAKRDDVCKSCGDKGHWARDCPKKNKGNRQGKRSGKSGPRKGRSETSSWRTTPPPDLEGCVKMDTVAGNDQYRYRRNDKTFYWCATCKHWSTTHWTHTHTGKKSTPTANANLTYLAPDGSDSDDSNFAPCAFFAQTQHRSDSSDLWSLLSPYLLPLFLALTWFFASPFAPTLWFTLGWFLGVGGPTFFAPKPSRRQPRVNIFNLLKNRYHGLRRWLELHPKHNPGPNRGRGRRRGPKRKNPKAPFRQRQPFPQPARNTAFGHCRCDELETQPCSCPCHPWNQQNQWNSKPKCNCSNHSGRRGRYNRRNRRKARQTQLSEDFSPNTVVTVLLTAVYGLRACLTNQHALANHLSATQRFPIIWDSGASISLSFDKADFVGPLEPPPSELKMKGIARGIGIEAVGWIAFAVTDSKGSLRTLRTRAVYCPDSKVKLLSTSALLQEYPSESIVLSSTGLTLSGNSGQTNSVCATLNPENNLPTSLGYCHSATEQLPTALLGTVSLVDTTNRNLTRPEKELLRWHFRIGHLGFKRLQFMMRQGILAKSSVAKTLHTTIAKLRELPMCAACQYAKAKRRPVNKPSQTLHTHAPVRDHSAATLGLTKDTLHPGQEVSVDHYICSTLGRLYSGYGKTADSQLYKGGCLFVDNATGFMVNVPQTSMTSHETLKAKEEFEFACRDYGILIQKYLTDQEAAFTSKDFAAHLRHFQQTIRFAGTGAHHHNGIAEKGIQDVMSIARTLLLHAAIHWPEVADPQLWPMAVDYAILIHNHVPRQDNGLSPYDLFTRQRWPHYKFHDFHVWGCPVYVLDKRIADGHKLPKWKAKSTRHIYLGQSSKHASTAPLTLNPETGAIGSQFHVVFDDQFATVHSDPNSLPDFGSPEWNQLFSDSEFQYPTDDPEDFPPLATATNPLGDVATSLDPYDLESSPFHAPPYESTPTPPTTSSLEREPLQPADARPIQRELPSPSQPPLPREPTVTTPSDPSLVPAPLPSRTPPTPTAPIPTSAPSPSPPSLEREIAPAATQLPTVSPPTPRAARELRRLGDHNARGTTESTTIGTRTRRRPSRFNDTAALASLSLCAAVAQMTVPIWNDTTNSFDTPGDNKNPFAAGFLLTPDHSTYRLFPTQADTESPCGYYDIPSPYLGYKPDDAPSIYLHRVELPAELLFEKKSLHDPDTLTWQQAMAESPDNVAKWLESADKEIKALEKQYTWEEKPLSEATVKVIPGTWVFRRKRAPDGTVTKWKARWVLRGDLQECDFDTYAAVVAWPTVRIFFILAIRLAWTIKALDFKSAFVQSTLDSLDQEIYAYLPRGYMSMLKVQPGDKACLRLRKSLYGLTVAPKLWADHLLKAVKELGFKESSYDSCLHYQEGMLLVCYVDDCGLAVKDPSKIDWFVTELRKKGFDLDVEGDFTAFLGVALDRLDDGTIHIHQQGLIDKIIAAAKMEDSNPNWTPSRMQALGSDPEGELYDNKDWSYSSIVGMLIYLATNSRPDISFAVSQVARYSKEPRQSHATAVKTIIRYLKRTRDKGMIVKIGQKMQLTCYVDADHCGLFGQEHPRNPDGARSRCGYIILLCGVPVCWKSTLMTAICLSTLEAEYQALSLAMKQLITYRFLLDELLLQLKLDNLRATIAATVFEDNQGALYLATNQRITSRTKYFHCKWHHFWGMVGPGKDKVRVVKVDTQYQGADYFTKSLPREQFENNRRLIQNW